MTCLNFRKEGLEHPLCNLVRAVVVVAVAREVALDLVVHDDAVVVDGLYLCVLDRRERVDDMGEARYTRRKRAAHIRVDERHLRRLVVVFIVHVLDDIQRIHVDMREPVHHALILHDDVVILEVLRTDRTVGRADLHARHFVHAAVDRVEQAFCEVRACAEELHLLARLCRRYAAADGVVVAPRGLHHVVVLVLDRARADGDARRIVLERLGQARGVEDGEVRLGGGPHVLERMEEAVVVLRDHVPAVHADARHFERRPDRVARKELIIRGDAREFHHAEFQHNVVDELLRLRLGERAAREVTLDIDVEESRDAADAHRCTVLGLDRREVGKVKPLHRLTCVLRGL